MNAIVTAMLWCAIQVTVLACGAMVVYLAARRLHPRAGAAAAGGALATVLLLTLLVASPWPRWNFSTRATESIAPAAAAAPTTMPHAVADNAGAGNDTVVVPPRLKLDSPQRAFWAALLDGFGQQAAAEVVDAFAGLAGQVVPESGPQFDDVAALTP